MKLSSLKQKLKEALPLIHSLSHNIVQSQTFRFNNIQKFRNGIEILDSTGIFEDEILTLKTLPIFLSVSDMANATNVDGKVFRDRANELIKNVELLSKSLKKLIIENEDENEENIIYIKLPNTNSLANLSKDIRIFNKILTNTIINDKIGGEVTLENVEPGSVWLKVRVGSIIAVSVIGSLSWAAAVVYKKYQEGKIIEEIVNQQKLDNENKKNLIDASKKLTDLLIEAEAKNIYNTYYENEEINPEQIERIKLAIKMLSEEIDKGAEINPALTAPESVTNLFPDMKSLPSVESRIKKLEK